MIDPAQLETLATVLRTGSFDAAASMLSVTPSAISQRIRALEDRMGTALLIRSLPVEPTEAGRRLARHADDVRLLEQSLRRDLGQDPGTDRPTIRIAVNADSLATWFLPALSALPDMLFDIVIDDQDHSDTLLMRGEVAAALTSRADPLPGAVPHTLGALRYLATASPAFCDRWFADGLTVRNLARAPALTFNAKDRLQRDWAARLIGRRVAMPSHVIGSSHAFVDAALLGLGWGMNPEALVKDHIAEGRLIALAPEEPLDVALYWQVSRLTEKALAPLTRAVRSAARSDLRQG